MPPSGVLGYLNILPGMEKDNLFSNKQENPGLRLNERHCHFRGSSVHSSYTSPEEWIVFSEEESIFSADVYL